MLLFDGKTRMGRHLLLAWDSMTKTGYPLGSVCVIHAAIAVGKSLRMQANCTIAE